MAAKRTKNVHFSWQKKSKTILVVVSTKDLKTMMKKGTWESRQNLSIMMITQRQTYPKTKTMMMISKLFNQKNKVTPTKNQIPLIAPTTVLTKAIEIKSHGRLLMKVRVRRVGNRGSTIAMGQTATDRDREAAGFECRGPIISTIITHHHIISPANQHKRITIIKATTEIKIRISSGTSFGIRTITSFGEQMKILIKGHDTVTDLVTVTIGREGAEVEYEGRTIKINLMIELMN